MAENTEEGLSNISDLNETFNGSLSDPRDNNKPQTIKVKEKKENKQNQQ